MTHPPSMTHPHDSAQLSPVAHWIGADLVYTDNQAWQNTALEIQSGKITAIKPVQALTDHETESLTYFSNAALIPGLVNSHNHSFQSLLKGICDDKDFFAWRDEGLYRYSRILTPEDLYNGALFAFGEMLLTGVTTVCDFFYINDQGNENALAIIQAAKDLGIRLTMARCLYDWEGAPGRFIETLDQAVGNIEALMGQVAGDPLIDVIPAPHSLHGASLPMIEAGNQLSLKHHKPFHMHVAEGQYERQMMLEKHGKTPIQLLDSLGLLNERLVGIHCVWLDDTDIALMAQRQAKLSYNPSSNMCLGDGVTKIRQMLDAGIGISLGTDGGSSNNRASIIDEMRQCNLLQKVVHCDATKSTAEEAFTMATTQGGVNLGLPIGSLKVGCNADMTVVNLRDLSMQPNPMQHFVKHLVYASQPTAIEAVYVAGRCVMRRGHLLHQDHERLIERIQATMDRAHSALLTS